MERSGLKVLYLAAEADPFIKVGGLGDVAGSLPAALRALSSGIGAEPETGMLPDSPEVDIRLVIPFHGAIQRQSYPFRSVATFQVQTRAGAIQAEALTIDTSSLPVYLITSPLIPPDAPVYTADPSVDGEKFTFFSLAALELARTLMWIPQVVHANDWHTSPSIYSLYLNREPHSFYYNTATLLGLHNLPYLGVGAEPTLEAFNLPKAAGSALPEWAQQMPLPLGLLAADHIVAPSPNYAREILTPEFGSGLHEFLRRRADSISGILNGVDTYRWDPRIDPYLPLNYGPETLSARQENKSALQKEFGLQVDPSIPLLAVVSRLDPQKGIDLVPGALRELPPVRGAFHPAVPWQVILLGTGAPELEEALRQLETDFPAQVRAAIRFDAALSHRIYAGADMLLIPSRYEPSGLTQMIAMRYGCVPVARATGGLQDTIQDYSPSAESTGFLFAEASSADLASAIRRGLAVYADPEAWRKLQLNGMSQDFSWEQSARQYRALYLSLVEQRQRLTMTTQELPKTP